MVNAIIIITINVVVCKWPVTEELNNAQKCWTLNEKQTISPYCEPLNNMKLNSGSEYRAKNPEWENWVRRATFFHLFLFFLANICIFFFFKCSRAINVAFDSIRLPPRPYQRHNQNRNKKKSVKYKSTGESTDDGDDDAIPGEHKPSEWERTYVCDTADSAPFDCTEFITQNRDFSVLRRLSVQPLSSFCCRCVARKL